MDNKNAVPNITMFGARCLIIEDKNEKKVGGLIRPGQDKEPTFRGTVIAVGKGAMLDTGVIVPMEVKVGDKVLYQSYSGNAIQVDGETYVVLNERDVLCAIR